MKPGTRSPGAGASLGSVRAAGVGWRGLTPSSAWRLKWLPPTQGRYLLRSQRGYVAGHPSQGAWLQSNAGDECLGGVGATGCWSPGSTPGPFRCRVRLSPLPTVQHHPSLRETVGESRGGAVPPPHDSYSSPNVNATRRILKSRSGGGGARAGPRGGLRTGAGLGGLSPSLAWRLNSFSPLQRRYNLRSTRGAVLRDSPLSTPPPPSNARVSSPRDVAAAGAWEAGSTPRSLRCRVRMSSSWRRTLAFPSLGDRQREDRRSAAIPSPGPVVTSLPDCPYPSHLLAEETPASSSQGSVSDPLVGRRLTMTSGVKGSHNPQKRKQPIARPADGEPTARRHRPRGCVESKPGSSGSGLPGVQPPQLSSTSLVRDPGDPIDAGVKSYTVRLPGLEPCGLCGKQPGTARELESHLGLVHRVESVLWACGRCGMSRPNRHQVSCHIPKCRVGRLSVGKLRCNLCPRVFRSVRGRSLHRLRAHTAAYLGMDSRRDGCHRRHVGFGERRPEEVNELTPAHLDMPSTSGSVATVHDGGKKGRQIWPQCGTSRKAIRKMGRLRRSQVSERSSPKPPQQSVEDALLEILHAASAGQTGKSDEVPITEDDCSQEAITSASSTLIREVGRMMGTGHSARKRSAGRPAIGSVQRCRSRRIVRQRLLRLYHSDRAKLASLVLDGQTGQICSVPLSEITAVFEGRWGDVRPFRGLGSFGGLGRADNSVFCHLVTPLEIMKNLRAIKGCFSPGPDGITKSLLLGWDPKGEKLAHMFSTWLVSGTLPRVFKRCRTVLIPKTTNPDLLGDVNQWRPITIGSMVLRLFSRILTVRMTAACPIHPRQRGFIASPGCSENLSVLEGVMRLSRQERVSLGVVFVDFAKAFDTVSHEHLLSALERKGLDQHMLELVRNSYEDCVTKVRCAEGDTADIAMKVGVKQGDSMSPLLFNIALDPLVQTLEREGQGFVADGKSITALAFADDLVLLSSSWDGMVANLDVLETFCELTGMRVQPGKCHGFFAETVGRSLKINSRPPWLLGGVPLNLIGPDEGAKYLGVIVNPWTGIVSKGIGERLQRWIAAIGGTPLGPIERVDLLVNYAIPRVIFEADHCMVSGPVLTEVDTRIRKAVKSWLHLPTCTTDGLLYSRKSSGGLGIPRLARVVASIQARRIYNLFHSSDETVRWISRRTIKYKAFKGAWRRAGGSLDELPSLDPPAEGGEVGPSPETSFPAEGITGTPSSMTRKRRLVPCDWRQVEFDKWANLKSQGRGIWMFEADKISNCWLVDPHSGGFTPGRYIAALQLRANVFPTRESAGRGRLSSDALCRYCRGSPETCSHILGVCPKVKLGRIQRHHKVCDLIETEAQSYGWSVMREVRWTLPSGSVLAPDLVFTKGDLALVVDVTIRYELKDDSLEEARLEKVAKYRPLVPVLLGKVPLVQRVQVIGFPVGARGKWPSTNDTFLKTLGLKQARRRSFAKLISRRTLLYSLDVLSEFMG
ncbi:uncharacterized protein LOC125884643 [Epinephelus fuscoguttatus]|uniref:uncharacterized protein LOC125884643 n=1 Tax=Epinephelus fuscoguttatus TaxID=293821 RepID=UPI0020D011C8|nr:uncharacterized protein LOC125884643 [Epinephelus fuscoguttatus]